MRLFAVVYVLVPIFSGLIGIGMHFIPNPSFRVFALLLAVAYTVFLMFLIARIRRPQPARVSASPTAPFLVVFAILMGTYFSYVTFFVSLPALLTEALGAPATREVVIEEIAKARSKAIGCPYRLILEDVVKVADDSFCVSGEFSRRHSVGHPIQLVGMETVMGFRFVNVN